jgi:hypothetical protein
LVVEIVMGPDIFLNGGLAQIFQDALLGLFDSVLGLRNEDVHLPLLISQTFPSIQIRKTRMRPEVWVIAEDGIDRVERCDERGCVCEWRASRVMFKIERWSRGDGIR